MQTGQARDDVSKNTSYASVHLDYMLTAQIRMSLLVDEELMSDITTNELDLYMSDLDDTIRKEMSTGQPYIKIVEQPAPKALRFRYECEGRSAGSIPGINSTPDNKAHPAIKVCNYQGPAIVIVSCVTKDRPYRPHPHSLVGKEGCKDGICTIRIDEKTMTCSFTNLGIQCVKRKEIPDALSVRETMRIDPYSTGFDHKNHASSMDLNCVRLCFQVFIEGATKNKYETRLKPVVSDLIYDKKAMSELIIVKLSACSAPVSGGTEIILLCDKVTKVDVSDIIPDDIEIRFYEMKNGEVVWEDFGDFVPADVHKQVAISFRTPRYKDQTIQKPVEVLIELRRKKDMAASTPREFQFTALDRDPEGMQRKRMKIDSGVLERYSALQHGSQAAVLERNIIQPIRFTKKDQNLDLQAAAFPFIPNMLPPQSVQTRLPPNYTLAVNQFPTGPIINTEPPPYPQVSQSQYSPVQAISPSAVTMFATAQSSPGESYLMNNQFTPLSIASSVASVIPTSCAESLPQNTFKNNLQTVHNVPPPFELEQGVDEHMSEKLSSLDLGIKEEVTEISIPLSDINLSLFESNNISLSKYIGSEDLMDESNNNAYNIQGTSSISKNAEVDAEIALIEENLVSTMSTDSFNRVNKELDTLNMLGLNVGIKSEMSST
ncbi:Embryonic polarity protein dorsal [Nymphon striatum]|nr:Embryonic polarity protein dorsal [Nymphon striatum]